ncbi:MAG: flagellar basal-body rod protein FlgF [Geobacteraceae bacterium GWC2_58_44]|nr:MAG: flagellar basal-body rod protein FlgF [Geobacteraceae bacterium GWC2_58_44]
MNSGMYAALSGNLSAMRRLEVISNNLANASTPGFKGDQIQFESVLAAVNNPTQVTPVFSNEQFSTDFTQGSLQKSDNVLDLALDGDGFFVVNTPQGPAYTRQGNFHRGAGGRLVNGDGYELQGKNGPISVAGGRIEIGAAGVVTVDGVASGTLAQVDFPKPYQLAKAGGGLFVPSNPQTATTPSAAEVKQGYLESSNVKVIVEMARMIEASRYFESCAKAVKSYDDMTAKAANELGKV